ncbi:MAG TPA: cardiolipin synthase [Ideonella sp.]|nr:cardiolipin synthase [Ideonella sp.]
MKRLPTGPSAALAAWLLAAGLAACAAPPPIDGRLAQPATTVRLDGAHGPLSAERSRAILEQLKSSGRDTGIFARHLALEQALVDTPLVTGNKVELLHDGPATYDAMFAAIARAKDHINLETYIVEDDAVGRRFADALIERQRDGVQVNLIYDGVGSLRTPRAFFDRLRASGIRLLQYNPVNPLLARVGWDVDERDHRKLLVVDGRVAFLGGINISDVYSSGSSTGGGSDGAPADSLPWRDTDLRIEGPVVADFQRLFLDTWASQKGPPLPPRDYFPHVAPVGRSVVRAIGGSPDEPYSQIYATLISAIASAETEVLLTNAYFAPDAQLLEALKGAVARGVDVKLLLPSTTDSSLVFWAGRSYYGELLEAGVKVYERHGALLHSKTALIDGVWSTVGSTNLDWRSFVHNREVNAVVLGDEFGRRMRAMFDADLADSAPVTLAQWQRRPLGMRLKEWFGRIWRYWL